MPGPAPQDRKHGRTPNSSGDWTEVDDKPFEGGKDLPKLPNRRKWHPMTEAWWKSTSTMPHCVLWRDEDWNKALMLAFELDKHFRLGDDAKTSALTEIRRREDELGIGYAARQRLRIKYVKNVVPAREGQEGPVGGPPKVIQEDGTGGPDAKVVSLSSRRADILSA